MSEKGLPGGHWMKVPGRFNKRGLTEFCEREQKEEGNVREGSSRGSMEEISGKVSTHANISTGDV